MKPIEIIQKLNESNMLVESDETSNKEKFIKYCKGKVKSLGTVKVKQSDISFIGYEPDEDEEDEVFDVRVDYISKDGTKALNAEDTVDMFGTENTYVLPNGNVMDGGDMDEGQLNHIAELDFKYIDKELYNQLLDEWDSWEMDMRFE